MLYRTFEGRVHVCINPIADRHTLCDTIFHHYNLRITSDRLNSRINQALTTRHGVEEELLRRQTLNEAALHEAARLGTVIILLEMRQRAVRETIGNALAIRCLLTHTGHHLRDVDHTALRSRTHHRHQAILIRQRRQTDLSRLLRRLIQLRVDLVLELLLIRLARVVVKEV